MAAAVAQDYPRISEGEKFAGLLDERKLTPHAYKIPQSKLRQIIADAVKKANRKASRTILNIPEKSTDAEMRKIFLKEGRKLLDYFRQYCGNRRFALLQVLSLVNSVERCARISKVGALGDESLPLGSRGRHGRHYSSQDRLTRRRTCHIERSARHNESLSEVRASP